MTVGGLPGVAVGKLEGLVLLGLWSKVGGVGWITRCGDPNKFGIEVHNTA